MACHLEFIKILMLGGVFVIAVAGVALPWCAQGREFTLGNLFSGGVLLAAALCHLLDDAQDGISDAIDDGTLDEFPWAPLFFGLGYLFMMTLEHSVIACVQARLKNGSPETPDFGRMPFAEEPLLDEKLGHERSSSGQLLDRTSSPRSLWRTRAVGSRGQGR